MTDQRPSSGNFIGRAGRAFGRGVLSVLVVIYMLVDELLTSILWPGIAWLSRRRIFARIGEFIAGLPPYAVLVLLAIPFVLIEPVKVIALVWIASGHFVQGPLLLVAAYVLSILSCDRIYHAGHGKLMQIGWFKLLMDWILALRSRALEWVRSTATWQAISRLWAMMRRRFVTSFRALIARLRR